MQKTLPDIVSTQLWGGLLQAALLLLKSVSVKVGTFSYLAGFKMLP